MSAPGASKFSVASAFGGAGVPLDREAADALDRYVTLLVKWNAKINLTAARHPHEVADPHLLDASFVAAGVTPGDRVVDVGSGAGLPGLVLAVLRRDVRVTLVEPNAKKVAFLRAAIEETASPNAEVVRGRDTDLPAEAWDRAVSRATMEPPIWLPCGARLVPVGGRVGVLVADEGKLPQAAGVSREETKRWVLPSGAPRIVAWYRRAR